MQLPRQEPSATRSRAEEEREQAANALEDAVQRAGGEVYSRFASTIEKVLTVVDPDEDFERLERDLQVGRDASQCDWGTLANALERSHTNYKDAHRLYIAANAVAEQVDFDCDQIESAMREDALAKLEAEKESGIRKKAITEGDISAMVSCLFPDEVRRIHRKRNSSKNAASQLKALAEAWRLRCEGLKSLTNGAR